MVILLDTDKLSKDQESQILAILAGRQDPEPRQLTQQDIERLDMEYAQQMIEYIF